MAEGLIAAALGGFGKALSSIGEMEAKKQNEAKLRKELMDMESEEKLRLDEVMFQRKQNRAIPEAQTTAKANVAGQVTTLEERSKTNLPALEAQNKVAGIDAELTAMSKSGIYDKQAKAKYDALNAEIDAAEKSGYDVKEARRTANALKAKFEEEKTAGIPKLQAEKDATQRLENVRALVEKNVVKEEADLLAKQELAKVQAMIAQGVPEAEAKMLAAKWKAGKTQRDEAAAEKTQNEINDAITKAGNKGFVTAERKLAATKHFVSGNGSSGGEKVTTADLHRKLEAAEDDLAEALGVPDKGKINEKIQSLQKKADSGDASAKKKLEEVEALRSNVRKRRNDLQSWRDKPEEDKSKSGNGKGKPSLESFNK
jgi:ribosomal protein L21